jgi:hypothetical protein
MVSLADSLAWSQRPNLMEEMHEKIRKPEAAFESRNRRSRSRSRLDHRRRRLRLHRLAGNLYRRGVEAGTDTIGLRPARVRRQVSAPQPHDTVMLFHSRIPRMYLWPREGSQARGEHASPIACSWRLLLRRSAAAVFTIARLCDLRKSGKCSSCRFFPHASSPRLRPRSLLIASAWRTRRPSDRRIAGVGARRGAPY